ncbi:flagellar basal body rod protein FlgB [Clostridium sediminicola]|uniref:flagellar basal body rod protein FlgB n=1 Tax=Clostridium sediminicola TaxID=3114879 RepID=UPI0031F234D9
MSKIIKNSTYDLMKNALDAVNLRQSVLTNNISNVNTPNFKASRVKFEETLKDTIGQGNVSLKGERNNHISTSTLEDIKGKVIVDKNIKVKEDGNSVDIEKEMMDMAANQILYNALVQQVNKKLSNISYVITGGR